MHAVGENVNFVSRAIARYFESGIAGAGHAYDCFCTDIFGGFGSIEAYHIRHESARFWRWFWATIFFKVKYFLGFLDDFVHIFHHFYRVHTYRSFSTEHHRIRTVEHSIGNVRHLGARGAGVGDHAIHHLSSYNNRSGTLNALADNFLLNDGHPLNGHLDTQVATGYHHAICPLDDFINIFYSLRFFDLGNNLRRVVFGFNQLAQLSDIFCCAYERKRNPVDRLSQNELQIPQVFFRKRWQGDFCIRQVYAFAGGEGAAEKGLELYNVVFIGFNYFKHQLAVVHQYAFSHLHILRELFVAHVNFFHRAHAFFTYESDDVAFLQFQGVVFDLPHAQFGALQIREDANVQVVLFIDISNVIDNFLMVGVGTMREIEPKDIHTGLYQRE